jgi:hypothetical protein
MHKCIIHVINFWVKIVFVYYCYQMSFFGGYILWVNLTCKCNVAYCNYSPENVYEFSLELGLKYQMIIKYCFKYSRVIFFQ